MVLNSENINPLLASKLNELPIFSKIDSEHVKPALEVILQKNRAALKQLLERTDNYTWENLVWPLEILEGELNDVWSIVSHLNAVKNTPAFNLAYQAALTQFSSYSTEIKHNEKLYKAFQSIANSAEYSTLTEPQKKIVENSLRNFKLFGINLSLEKRKQFKEKKILLAELESKFEQNILESAHAWFLHITDREKLNGLPVKALNAAHAEAKNRGKLGWVLRLDYPAYSAIMNYLEDREIRYEVYKAYITRASKNFPAGDQWDNGPLMIEILKVRHALAQLLGFSNFAEYELQTRMLKKTSEVKDFLFNLLDRSRKKGEEEIKALKQFAKEELSLEELKPWDLLFVSEKLLQKNHEIDEETLRSYFPVDAVLEGLFAISKRLFGLQIKEITDFDKWDEDVRLFEVFDNKENLRGKFYLDIFTRYEKHGGAWLSCCRQRMLLKDGKYQIPVAMVVANLSKPSTQGLALLTHQEVITIFHEFGHCLHSILTTVDYPSIAGGHGVEWDAIEFPSQLLENWCWEREGLDLISRHLKDHAPLPDELYGKLKALKHFHQGMSLVHQLEFALLDFRLHMEAETLETEADIQKILDNIRSTTALIPAAPFNRYQNSFTHMFSGGYSAGYYSYLWSEVMSFDAYRLFKKRKLVFDEVIAKRFLSSILETGGSKDFLDLFIEFRGRAPKIDALLEAFGLEN